MSQSIYPTPSSTICFKDINFLNTYGLSQKTALDYFSLSQFYDRTSNNELVKMQTQYNTLTFEKMLKLKGVEYVLSHVQEPILYVISKQYRYSETETSLLDLYYILDGVVYKCSSVYDVVNMRVNSVGFYFKEVLRVCEENRENGMWVGDEKEEVGNGVLDQFLYELDQNKV